MSLGEALTASTSDVAEILAGAAGKGGLQDLSCLFPLSINLFTSKCDKLC